MSSILPSPPSLATLTVPGLVSITSQTFGGQKSFHDGAATSTLSDLSLVVRHNFTTTTNRSFSPVVDGASALAHLIDTVNTLSNSTAQILSVRNAGTEAFGIYPNASTGAHPLLKMPESSEIQIGTGKMHSTAGNWVMSGNLDLGTNTISAANITGTNTGDVTIGAFGGSDAKGLIMSAGQVLNLAPASLTTPGGVSTGSQTFAGDKTFNDNLFVTGTTMQITNNGAQIIVRTPGDGWVFLNTSQGGTFNWIVGATIGSDFIRSNSGDNGNGINFGGGRNAAGSFTTENYNHVTGYKSAVKFTQQFTPASGSGKFAALELNPNVNGTSTGSATALAIAIKNWNLVGGSQYLIDAGITSTDYGTGYASKFKVDIAGNANVFSTLIVGGVTPGSTTIGLSEGLVAPLTTSLAWYTANGGTIGTGGQATAALASIYPGVPQLAFDTTLSRWVMHGTSGSHSPVVLETSPKTMGSGTAVGFPLNIGSGSVSGDKHTSWLTNGVEKAYLSYTGELYLPYSGTGGAATGHANINVTGNPATSSPALANFGAALELGGKSNPLSDPASADIYLGAMYNRTAGPVVTILNNYGQGGTEVPVFQAWYNGDAKVGGNVYLNNLAGSDGRVIVTAGSLYEMSADTVIVWKNGSNSHDIVEWYKDPGGTLMATLNNSGDLLLNGGGAYRGSTTQVKFLADTTFGSGTAVGFKFDTANGGTATGDKIVSWNYNGTEFARFRRDATYGDIIFDIPVPASTVPSMKVGTQYISTYGSGTFQFGSAPAVPDASVSAGQFTVGGGTTALNTAGLSSAGTYMADVIMGGGHSGYMSGISIRNDDARQSDSICVKVGTTDTAPVAAAEIFRVGIGLGTGYRNSVVADPNEVPWWRIMGDGTERTAYGKRQSDVADYTRLNYHSRGTTAFTGTITGGTSGATATLVSDSRLGGTSGDGYLMVSGVTGHFVLGETITGTTGSATLIAFFGNIAFDEHAANIGGDTFLGKNFYTKLWRLYNDSDHVELANFQGSDGTEYNRLNLLGGVGPFRISRAEDYNTEWLTYTGRGTTQFSGTVTGSISGATATVFSDGLAGGVSGSGTLIVHNVTGQFFPTETLTAGGVTGTLTVITPYRQALYLTAVSGVDHNQNNDSYEAVVVGTEVANGSIGTPGDYGLMSLATGLAAGGTRVNKFQFFADGSTVGIPQRLSAIAAGSSYTGGTGPHIISATRLQAPIRNGTSVRVTIAFITAGGGGTFDVDLRNNTTATTVASWTGITATQAQDSVNGHSTTFSAACSTGDDLYLRVNWTNNTGANAIFNITWEWV